MQNDDPLILESCVQTSQDALKAEKNNASRIELCGDLSVGGITPDRKLIDELLNNLTIPIKVMIRPRGGGFVYTTSEFEKMISDIRYCREIGIKEIVTGILTPNNNLDIRRLQVLGSIASPMEISIHKCIDETEDPISEIKKLNEVPQITSILTSGKSATALEGKGLLKEMVEVFKDQFVIIPAGKITTDNLNLVHSEINAREYHGRKIV